VEQTAWNVADVAEYLKVSKPMVYVLIDEHGLPCSVVGKGNKRFTPESVKKWLLAREVVGNVCGDAKAKKNRAGD
jgi:excisionase family DNA binding protein